MTIPEVERRLAALLEQHAEDAMDRTSTDERLRQLPDDIERAQHRRRVVWAAGVGAAAAVAAGVVAVSYVANQSQTASPAQGEDPVTVAEGFLDAYASFDQDKATTYLADDAGFSLVTAGTSDWRQGLRYLEATRGRILLDACRDEDGTSGDTLVTCGYELHAMGSDELGRGPFRGNSFTVTVTDGEVTSVVEDMPFATNGFSDEMWEPFAAWVESRFPKDGQVMYADWPVNSLQAVDDRAIALWAEHVQDYVADVQAGNAD